MADRRAFPLLGEPLALDLVNTRVRTGGTEVDLLGEPDGLAAWLGAQRDRLAWTGDLDAADVDAVRTLRDAIASLLAARRAGTLPPPDALAAVNVALAAPVTAQPLTWTADGPCVGAGPVGAQRQRLLHVLAADAVTLLTGPAGALLRTCEHPDCVVQFLARNPRRRWCSAAGCGNRARVARHYTRHRPAG